MKIAILDSQRAFLPEINAYINYLNKNGFEVERVFQKDLNSISKFDIVWKFPGIDIKKNKEVLVIHEYNSLSVGKNGAIKDLIKKHLNARPNGRIFLNETVKTSFNFKDNVPSIYREMGIAENFFIKNQTKEYDCVYIGAMDENRELDKLLVNFKNPNCPQNILMIGKPNDNLYKEFKDNKNIVFTGIVPNDEVAALASKASYGVNYIPNVTPYNMQTSTKLLEYCALGLNIITTDYAWARKFERAEGGHFYKISGNINFEEVENYNYITPNVENYKWDTVLQNVKLIDFLKNIR